MVVVLPQRAPERLAAELVAQHARWIDRHRRRLLDELSVLAARPAIGDGRPVTLRGLPHDVYVERAPAAARRSTVLLEHHSVAAIVVRRAAGDGRSPTDLLERWLRRVAREDLAAAMAARAAEIGVRPARLTVRDQRTRWGSASVRGTLSFSWRLVLCPPEILDYVVVHELAHLRVGGHSARFWGIVHRHALAAEHSRRWLRRNERLLRRALD